MPKFVLAFRGGMPKSPDEGQKMMTDWNAWMAELGPALVDKGAGFGKSRFLTGPDSEGKAGDALSGYSLVEAQDVEAALDMARKNPIFSLGGTIEVAECMQM
ncbi:MAG: hypothetical protein JJ864_04175 [Rhizobiaceae bacterium]|nr:hypothetical protein [Rhizobiaceae bacterium]